jgi:WD40 repeat protein
VASGELRGELIGHTQRILDVAFSPEGTILVSRDQGEVIKIWHVPTRRFLFDLASQVQSVGFSPSGTYLAYARSDGGIVVHDLEALCSHR